MVRHRGEAVNPRWSIALAYLLSACAATTTPSTDSALPDAGVREDSQAKPAPDSSSPDAGAERDAVAIDDADGDESLPRIASSLNTVCVVRRSDRPWCVGALQSAERVERGPAPWDVDLPGAPADGVAAAGEALCFGSARNPSLRCMGLNRHGLLAVGSSDEALFLPEARAVDLAGVLLLLDGDGSTFCAVVPGKLQCWGDSPFGGAPSNLPQQVAIPGAIRRLSVGARALCVADDGGGLSCAGLNPYGGLGQDPSGLTTLSSLTRVPGLPAVLEVSVGVGTSCAVDRDRRVWCWGDNSRRLLGRTDVTLDFRPRVIPSLGEVSSIDVGAVACAVKLDGSVWCWGPRHGGLIGDGAWIRPTPEALQDDLNYASIPERVFGVEGAIAVTVGGQVACALTRGDHLWCWGGQHPLFDPRRNSSQRPYLVSR